MSAPADDPRERLLDTRWEDLLSELRGVLAGETDPVANAANTAALLFTRMPAVNWAGFYFQRGEDLVLGPFQGQPACTRIALGKGVCGAAAARRETLVVPDVHAFPGHIVCDSASRSEIVAPLLLGSRVLGVLDIDSPALGRFTEADRAGVEAVAVLYVESCHPELFG